MKNRKKKNKPKSLNDELSFDEMDAFDEELEELLKHTPKAAAARTVSDEKKRK